MRLDLAVLFTKFGETDDVAKDGAAKSLQEVPHKNNPDRNPDRVSSRLDLTESRAVIGFGPSARPEGAANGHRGDTIAMTAASNLSIEDLVVGALPGVPRVVLHNPVLAYENGDEFLAMLRRAAAGEMRPFILVFEGSVPDESLAGEGCWAGFGLDRSAASHCRPARGSIASPATPAGTLTPPAR